MSQAIIHGKISRSGANLTSASEDLLTGTVFGSLRYLLANDLLIPLLQESRSVLDESKRLRLDENNDAKITFWPLYNHSEPDVVVEFSDHLIFIQAKLYAGKSRDFDVDALEEDEQNEAAAARDQLAREFLDLKEQANDNKHRISLIYLTAPRVKPENSINRSIQASENLDKLDPDKFKKKHLLAFMVRCVERGCKF